MRILQIATVCFLVAGCAATTVTPVSRNQIIISTEAAPACGRTGAAKVANRMAAVETLRRGFQRFVIVGASSASNVSAVTTAPTYAYTNSNVTGYGNYANVNSTTTFGGSQTIFVGSNDADLGVLMLNPKDQGFSQGIDAKSELGPKWQELVKSGINTCTE